MLISNNRNPSFEEFAKLIDKTLDFMNQEVQSDPERKRYYRSQNGAKLEKDVFEVLTIQALGTDFENTIELISNRSFPDIVAAKYYGVEVKTSKKGWRSVGSSIMESSRIQDVEHICLFFGKLDKDVEFMARPYQECLSEIVVTHSPRYSIDMNLTTGSTIFDKMDIHYESFRKLDSPIDTVKDYYRSTLREGQDLWWMTNNEQPLSPVVQIWNTLSQLEQTLFRIQGYCWFPEIFGNSQKKYNRFAIWLVTQNGVVAPALRDVYSSGIKTDFPRETAIALKNFNAKNAVLVRLIADKDLVRSTIIDADEDWVKEMWGVRRVLKGEERLKQWIHIVSEHRNIKAGLYKTFGLR